jgi:hypothetical protein
MQGKHRIGTCAATGLSLFAIWDACNMGQRQEFFSVTGYASPV